MRRRVLWNDVVVILVVDNWCVCKRAMQGKDAEREKDEQSEWKRKDLKKKMEKNEKNEKNERKKTHRNASPTGEKAKIM